MRTDVHYAIYYQGNLVTASGGMPPSCRALPTCTPVGGAMGAGEGRWAGIGVKGNSDGHSHGNAAGT